MKRFASYAGVAALLALPCRADAAAAQRRAEPQVLSSHPAAVRTGMPFSLVFRGPALGSARAFAFGCAGASGRVVDVQSEPPVEGQQTIDRVRAEVSIPAGAAEVCPVRLVTAEGVTNEWRLRLTSMPLVREGEWESPLSKFPVAIAGTLAERGEADLIWLQVKRGEHLTIVAASSTPAFDPSLAIMEPGGSWFDESRLNRIAFNDEPLHFPGLSNEAILEHRFEKEGRYAIQVRAFSGQGGPDYAYDVRIYSGAAQRPPLHPKLSQWSERQFVRRIPEDWLTKLSARGDNADQPQGWKTVQASSDPQSAPVIQAPALVEGRIGKPAETHLVRLRVDKPQDLAIEVETPSATMPRFNPVVRLMAPDGGEIVTNVYTKRNNNGLYMMKMIQAKSTFTLRSAGEYLLEIRDITTDVAGDDFHYRVLIRPQIPHVGDASVVEDRVNLSPGEAKSITVNLEREEEFNGLVALSVEGLPAGVTAVAGLAKPVDKPPLPNAGRLERYSGKPQTATILLTADDAAALTELPVTARVVLRTIVNGRPSRPIPLKELPVMVIPRRPS